MSRWNHTEFPVLAPGVLWTILGHADRVGYFRCRCECGTESVLVRGQLQKGRSKSCGCLKASLVSKARKVHGRSRTPIHNVWSTMIDRCENPNTESYPLYGGNGVVVCDRWKGTQGFVNFLADMGERPSDKHSIDRYPDREGNYEPTNCRWALPAQQARNRKSNINITWDGRTQCLSDWAAELDIGPQNLKYRIKHWGLARAMTTPKDPVKGRKRDG